MNVALILNYKAATETISCVESLLAHCPAVDHVVVIDNDSQDGSFAAFTQWREDRGLQNVTVLANPQNNGYAGGNNYGLRWALENLQPEYFWIVNNDTYVDSDAFAPLLQALKQNDNQFVGSVILSAIAAVWSVTAAASSIHCWARRSCSARTRPWKPCSKPRRSPII